jgi:hypothetical protein
LDNSYCIASLLGQHILQGVDIPDLKPEPLSPFALGCEMLVEQVLLLDRCRPTGKKFKPRILPL